MKLCFLTSCGFECLEKLLRELSPRERRDIFVVVIAYVPGGSIRAREFSWRRSRVNELRSGYLASRGFLDNPDLLKRKVEKIEKIED